MRNSKDKSNNPKATEKTGESDNPTVTPVASIGSPALTSNKAPAESDGKKGTAKEKSFLRRLKKDIKKPTVILEILALFGLAIYTCEAHRANVLTKQSLNSGQRAYLSYGELEVIDGGIKIHLFNFGHVPAKVTGGSLRYQRNRWPENISMADISRPVKPMTVAPGEKSDSILMVSLPDISDPEKTLLNGGHEALAISGIVEYDDGFNESDRLLIAINYEWRKNSWVHSGAGTEVEFGSENK